MSVETTLFYSGACGLDFNDLVGQIKSALADAQIVARTKYASRFDLALAVGDVTLTVAQSPVPLDKAPYVSAKAPAHYAGLSILLGRVLAEHQSAIMIRVTGPDHAAKDATRRALCYIAAQRVFAICAPDLIHWGPSGTLYSLSSFCRQTGDPVPESDAKRRMKADHAAVSGWMAHGELPGMQDAIDDLRNETLQADAFSNGRPKSWPLGCVSPPWKLSSLAVLAPALMAPELWQGLGVA